jgi:hypothetical protein
MLTFSVVLLTAREDFFSLLCTFRNEDLTWRPLKEKDPEVSGLCWSNFVYCWPHPIVSILLQQFACRGSVADHNNSLVALQSGGFIYPWTSAYVLCPLFMGILLIVTFLLWEWKGVKNPMIPKEIFAGQRIVGFVFSIAFVSGMNLYSMLNFLPL